MFPWQYCIIAIVAYGLGCINVGLIVSRRVAKMDIRKYGSGNAGSTNMLRVLGWGPSLLTLLGDTLKAVLAVLAGIWWMGEIGGYVGGLFVIVGHNWPVFFKFKGGKGVAATLGVTLVTLPLMGVAGVAIVAITMLVFGYVSLGSLISFLLMPLAAYLAYPGNWWFFGFFTVLAALGFFSHRANIKRLIQGKENKLNLSRHKNSQT